MAYNFLKEGKSKLTIDPAKVTSADDFQAAIDEAKASGLPYHLSKELEGECYRALCRKIDGELKHGSWSYSAADTATLDAMVARYGKDAVYAWAINEFLTDGDDAAVRGEGKGRVSAKKSGSIATIIDTYNTLVKAGMQKLAEETAIGVAKNSGVLKEVAAALKLDIEII